jgi:phage tail tape-measure protein
MIYNNERDNGDENVEEIDNNQADSSANLGTSDLGETTGTLTDAVAGAMIGAPFGLFGTVIGGVAGGVIGNQMVESTEADNNTIGSNNPDVSNNTNSKDK